MTIRLTLKCSESCKHCLVNATPDKDNMSNITLNNILQLLKYINIPVLNISGGEITEIDDWFDKINYIINFIRNNNLQTKLCLLSNGTFIFDNNKLNKMYELLNNQEIYELYLSTNKLFYKNHDAILNRINNINLPKLKLNLFDRKPILKNLGRAKNLNVNLNTTASCALPFKIIQYCKTQNLKELINKIPIKHCSPMINVDGNIYLGWSNECKCIGNINTDSYDTIYYNMKNYIPCYNCKQKFF